LDDRTSPYTTGTPKMGGFMNDRIKNMLMWTGAAVFCFGALAVVITVIGVCLR